MGACLGTGATNEVVAVGLRAEVIPLMGTALLAEYEDVLGRPELFTRSRLDPAERDALLDIFLARCRWTRVYYRWRPNVPDEGDNHLVELAIAGGAQAIVTWNLRDLLRMELRFPTLKILKPEGFLREVRR
ncbi:putative toxin-antitoxin system toxin component, PIN family [uncultured Thiodictyon sp.]|uniref:PIN domain-containing protein n=1 Tax=uncultured Thiodictyon sp. TaxID=1846217 RepID=UPI0025D40701|nr:PIN domain-containing protein [uncultured Thiodictyon sp.]